MTEFIKVTGIETNHVYLLNINSIKSVEQCGTGSIINIEKNWEYHIKESVEEIEAVLNYYKFKDYSWFKQPLQPTYEEGRGTGMKPNFIEYTTNTTAEK